MKIEINKVVNAEYELYVDGENGELELMERATPIRSVRCIFRIINQSVNLGGIVSDKPKPDGS